MRLYFKPEWRIPATIGVLSFSAGVGIGILGLKFKQKREDDAEYEEYLERIRETTTPPIDVNQMRMEFVETEQAGHFNRLKINEEAFKEFVETPTEIVDELKDFRWPDHLPEPEDEEYPPDVSSSIYRDLREPTERVKDVPYTISSDEFHGSETGFRQGDLTYYAGDNVLCDEKSVPVYRVHDIVGEMEFGRMSGDSNVVYVRNENLQGEWMITRIDDTYQSAVHGIELEEEAAEDIANELKHSHVRKFKLD